MKTSAWASLILVALAAFAAATDNYAYEPGEYATISDGLSPDGQWSIAAHGDGPYGSDDFHLFLMREPAHEKLAPLRTGEHLDTGPLSIAGLWAPDSKRVAVLYRSDRHVLALRLFGIAGGRARAIEVPSLVSAVGTRFLKPKVHRELLGRFYRVAWTQADRFALEEFATFDAAEEVFRSGVEPYVNVERLGAERTFTDFSAKTVVEITEKGKAQLLETKPVPLPAKAVVYTPHLSWDAQRGLHNSETTMSSLAAPRSR